MTSDERPLESLTREQAPPPELEDRVVHRLRERRLLSSDSRRRTGWWLLPLAASIVGIAFGWALRDWITPARPASDAPQFLLLLSNDPVEGPTMAERVEMYRDWAIDLDRRGLLVAARKLDSRGVEIDGAFAPTRSVSADASSPSGYFLIRADNLEEAIALARESPHAKLGGRVTVRPIDPV